MQDSARGQDEFDGRCSGLEPDGQQAWSAILAWLSRRGGLGLSSEAAFPEVEGELRNGLDGAELCDGQAGGREARQTIHPELACGGPGSRGGSDEWNNDDFGHRKTSQRADDPSKLSDASRT